MIGHIEKAHLTALEYTSKGMYQQFSCQIKRFATSPEIRGPASRE